MKGAGFKQAAENFGFVAGAAVADSLALRERPSAAKA
jgi:hypothetical protein